MLILKKVGSEVKHSSLSWILTWNNAEYLGDDESIVRVRVEILGGCEQEGGHAEHQDCVEEDVKNEEPVGPHPRRSFCILSL